MAADSREHRRAATPSLTARPGGRSAAVMLAASAFLGLTGCHADAVAPTTAPAAVATRPTTAPSSGPAAHEHGAGHGHGHGHGHHAQAARGLVCFDVYAEAGGATLHLLTATKEQAGAPPALAYRRSTDAGETWSAPVRVGDGMPPAKRANAGMEPRVAAHGETVLAVWSAPGTGYMGAGPMTVARSTDGGRTWSPAPNPADDNSTAGHDFIALAADDAGRFHLAWLDGRNGKQGLRYARSADGGLTWSKNATLDDETCECCWNRIAVAPSAANGKPGAVYVLYRDKGAAKLAPRDMALARSDDGGDTWTTPEPCGKFTWVFDGCPHTGGGLAIDAAAGKARALATVWTGRSDNSGVYLVRSPEENPDDPRPPQRVGSARANHPDLAVSADGRGAAIVWDAHGEDGNSAVHASTSGDGFWSAVTGPVSKPGASAEYPRVVPTPGGGFRAFWIEQPAAGGATAWASAPLR